MVQEGAGAGAGWEGVNHEDDGAGRSDLGEEGISSSAQMPPFPKETSRSQTPQQVTTDPVLAPLHRHLQTYVALGLLTAALFKFENQKVEQVYLQYVSIFKEVNYLACYINFHCANVEWASKQASKFCYNVNFSLHLPSDPQ